MSSVAAPTYGMTVILSRYFLHPPTKSAARFYAERGNATEIRSGGGVIYDRAIKLRRRSPLCKEKKKKRKNKKKRTKEKETKSREKIRIRFSSLRSFMRSAGIICAEGDLWRDQRRFVAGCLKNFGMVKLPGTKRDRMEERILMAVNECISVN